MARKGYGRAQSGRTILLVDDSHEYLTATRRVIEREGHTVLAASGPRDGLALLTEHDVDLVLVDYLMPGMTGEEFVRELRGFRPDTQVILQTGYASEHPPRELLQRMDIQGYHDKSDGPGKLLLWVDIGLKAAYSRQLLVKSRAGLRYILEVTPQLHQVQPLEDLLQGILLQTCGLLGATNGLVAAIGSTSPDDGFVAMKLNESDLAVRAATERYRHASRIEDAVDGPVLERMRAVIAGAERIGRLPNGTIAPLRVAGSVIGLVYFDRALTADWEAELIELFANQAAVAIQNASLYDMAAHDALTGVATRRFFEMSMARELRVATRTRASTGLLIVDIDQMKSINDTYGHQAGDQALATIGACLLRSVRATDIVGRIGGDEFAVLLPSVDHAGAEVVAGRLRASLDGLGIEHAGTRVPIEASLGAAVLDGEPPTDRAQIESAIASVMRRLIEAADGAMYRDKRSGTTPGPDLPRIRWAA